MWSKLLKLSLEELRFLVGNCLLIENKNIGDVIGVNLRLLLDQSTYFAERTCLVLEILQHLKPLFLDQIQPS